MVPVRTYTGYDMPRSSLTSTFAELRRMKMALVANGGRMTQK